MKRFGLGGIDDSALSRYITNQSVSNMDIAKIFCKSKPEGPVKNARRKEARPGELLDAALDLFIEKVLPLRGPKK
jgi:hypothetical protein